MNKLYILNILGMCPALGAIVIAVLAVSYRMWQSYLMSLSLMTSITGQATFFLLK